MLYVEKMQPSSAANGTSSAQSERSTSVASRGWCSGASVAKALSVVKAEGHGLLACPPGKLDKDKLKAFSDMLSNEGIDLSRWGRQGTKSVEHLFWETHEQRGCIIIRDSPATSSSSKLKRVTRLVKIKLIADIFGVEHALFSRLQFMHDGQNMERKQVPLKKLMWTNYDETADNDPRLFEAPDCPYTEDWSAGCRLALKERLGLSERWQEDHLEQDHHAYHFQVEDNVESQGYPGLNTCYCIHEVTYRIVDSEHPGVQCVGLPHGREFATAEGDFNFGHGQDEGPLPIGTQLNIWKWDRRASQGNVGHAKRLAIPAQAKESKKAKDLRKQVVVESRGNLQLCRSSQPKQPLDESQLRAVKRVPLRVAPMKLDGSRLSKSVTPTSAAAECSRTLSSFEETSPGGLAATDGDDAESQSPSHAPSSALRECLRDAEVDWEKVRSIARRIADDAYTLEQFNQDLAEFPELGLYLLDEEDEERHTVRVTSSSSRSLGDEYQRTVGAFFAIYWLLRLRRDGREGFSFGVDREWQPIAAPEKEKVCDVRLFPAEKRIQFYRENQWEHCEQLLIDADLISLGEDGQFVLNEARVMTLLALTAIHDIMKMETLLPTVQAEHAPYHGYRAGDVIGDHDAALGYVMDHYPELLPSFAGLEPDQRKSVQFTQCQLCFNHGWFVQAEAPPGALFTKFREALLRDHHEVRPQDIALYFVHWLTDLAGAEPTPLGGCEKFVMKFPLPVLNSFLRSFTFINRLTSSTETEVTEEYLKVRWQEHAPPLGEQPTGPEAIAKMRLACMAQTNAAAVLKAFPELPREDREILSTEMARTGCIGQSFSSDLCPPEVQPCTAGPALLIYYGPAFLQNLGCDCPMTRLGVLAEVYRCARELWPAEVTKTGTTVIVRIDTIKGLSIADMSAAMREGHLWVMVKHNETEAFIERSTKKKLNWFITTHSKSVQILDVPDHFM